MLEVTLGFKFYSTLPCKSVRTRDKGMYAHNTVKFSEGLSELLLLILCSMWPGKCVCPGKSPA